MQLPEILKVRVMTKIMPEEVLLDGAIEELVRYKEALKKYNEASKTEDSTENKQSLKDKLFGAKKESSSEKPSHSEAASRTMAILVKWIDEERSMEEIVASSHTLNEVMGKQSSNE